MEGMFKVTTTMSIGSTGSAVVFKTFNDKFDPISRVFSCDLNVWKSQSDKDDGKDSTHLFGSGKTISSIVYDVPQADIDQAIADEHLGIVWENHVKKVKDTLAASLSITAANIQITSPL